MADQDGPGEHLNTRVVILTSPEECSNCGIINSTLQNLYF